MIQVSVIIPVFNAEKHILDCISSIQSKSVSVEIICVNDGSTDSSLAVLTDIADRDHRIRIISTENRGVVYARERAIQEAKADYLFFIDADDTLPNGVLDCLYDIATTSNSDVVIGDINHFDDGVFKHTQNYGNERIIAGVQLFQWIVQNRVGYLWGKLFRKSLFDNLRMPYGMTFCEDFMIMLRLCCNVNIVSKYQGVVYNYFQRIGSACNSKKDRHWYISRFDRICHEIQQIVVDKLYGSEDEIYLRSLYVYYCRLLIRWRGERTKDIRRFYIESFFQKGVAQQIYNDSKFRFFQSILVLLLLKIS